MSAALDKVITARSDLVLDHPFFGVLALRLKLVEDPTCKTAWTDGRSIGYSPAYVLSLTKKQLLGLMCHEILHCANGHPWRRDQREPRRWNVACDYAINFIIEETKIKGTAAFELPKGRLRDAKFDGQSAEWIFDRVTQEDVDRICGDEDGDGDGSGDATGPARGGWDVRDAPQDGQPAPSEAEWQEAVQQAAAAAKARGKLPTHLEKFAAQASQPRVEWRSALRRFIQQVTREDYNWTRPNRRYLAHGLYLPALHSETIGPIAVAVDTSGSCFDQVTLDQFAGELNSIVQDVRPSKTVVIYADAKVHRVDEFYADDVVEFRAVGGGGTSHVPVMDYVDEMEEQPVCLVCLTDLATAHRQEAPAMPVLWATTHEAEVPYGEVLSLQR